SRVTKAPALTKLFGDRSIIGSNVKDHARLRKAFGFSFDRNACTETGAATRDIVRNFLASAELDDLGGSLGRVLLEARVQTLFGGEALPLAGRIIHHLQNGWSTAVFEKDVTDHIRNHAFEGLLGNAVARGHLTEEDVVAQTATLILAGLGTTLDSTVLMLL